MNYNKQLIGLTGGIGAGKSTVAEILKRFGAYVISADEIAKDIMDENEDNILDWIKHTFGTEFIDNKGKLKRKEFGQLVFSNGESKKLLDDRIFPLIHRRMKYRVEKAFESTNIVVVDAAMIFEWGIEKEFDKIITVIAPVKFVYSRLRERDGLSEDEIKDRINSQLDPALKAQKSDFIIDNEGDFDVLREKVLYIWNKLNM